MFLKITAYGLLSYLSEGGSAWTVVTTAWARSSSQELDYSAIGLCACFALAHCEAHSFA